MYTALLQWLADSDCGSIWAGRFFMVLWISAPHPANPFSWLGSGVLLPGTAAHWQLKVELGCIASLWIE